MMPKVIYVLYLFTEFQIQIHIASERSLLGHLFPKFVFCQISSILIVTTLVQAVMVSNLDKCTHAYGGLSLTILILLLFYHSISSHIPIIILCCCNPFVFFILIVYPFLVGYKFFFCGQKLYVFLSIIASTHSIVPGSW